MLTLLAKQIKTACLLFLVMSVLTGLIYPATITAFAQLFFSWQANGSLVKAHSTYLGSTLLGQSFHGRDYFWSRPSATRLHPYDALHSQGSNLAPSNQVLIAQVKQRMTQLQAAIPTSTYPIPIDLLTASGSGLDPEISPLAAFFQAARIAKERQIPEKEIQQLIKQHIKERTFFILGERRVNVLELNLALDALANLKGNRRGKPAES